RGELGETVRLGELERGLGSVEDGLGRAENARRGVTLEGLDPGLVGLAVHPEANEDPVGGLPFVERGTADTYDRHDDSMVVTPEPFARQVRHTETESFGCRPGSRTVAAIDQWPTGVVGGPALRVQV